MEYFCVIPTSHWRIFLCHSRLISHWIIFLCHSIGEYFCVIHVSYDGGQLPPTDTLTKALAPMRSPHPPLYIHPCPANYLNALSEIGLGCFGHWQPSLGRLVDPFLMYNDGFMSRISPLEDFGRLWKGSKWPIGIQIRRSGGESRFIFFLVAGQYHRTFTLFRY